MSETTRGVIKESEIVFDPTLLIIRGIPGSGKSYLADNFRGKFPDSNLVVLDPDAINKEDFEYKNFIDTLSKKEPEVGQEFYPFRFLVDKASRVLQNGGFVLWNQAFTNLEGLEIAIKMSTKKSPDVKVLVVDLEISSDLASERVQQREKMGGRGISQEVFSKFVERFQKANCMMQVYMCLDSSCDVNINVSEILKKLASI